MMFKSSVQPLCRCCGKPIKKWTRPIWVRPEPRDTPMSDRTVVGLLRSKEDCQRLTNEKVTAVRYTDYPEHLGRHAVSFNTWDGESYESEFFCSGTCAQNFGLLAAKLNRLTTRAYSEAIEERKDREWLRNQRRDKP